MYQLDFDNIPADPEDHWGEWNENPHLWVPFRDYNKEHHFLVCTEEAWWCDQIQSDKPPWLMKH